MNNKSASVAFGELLLLAFVVLKLCGVINWSWLWVLSPLWIPLILFVVGFVVYAIVKMWKNRGTVPCSNCKYGHSETGYFGMHYYCRKNHSHYSKDHRCKEGEYSD